MNEILGKENIHILPPGLEEITDLSKIPRFPSPKELMYKYVVKAKATRRIPAALKKEDAG
jgi:hypothetical protein